MQKISQLEEQEHTPPPPPSYKVPVGQHDIYHPQPCTYLGNK